MVLQTFPTVLGIKQGFTSNGPHYSRGQGMCMVTFEPHHEKTGFLPMRKQMRRSASQ